MKETGLTGVDWIRLPKGSISDGSFEHCNKHLRPVKGEEFVHRLFDCVSQD
jgi:hypothetical protein